MFFYVYLLRLSHPSNILVILTFWLIFLKQLKNFKDKHLENIYSILVTLFIFHLEISGKFDKFVQQENIYSILLTFWVSHFDISGKDSKEVHPQNK